MSKWIKPRGLATAHFAVDIMGTGDLARYILACWGDLYTPYWVKDCRKVKPRKAKKLCPRCKKKKREYAA